MIKVFAISFICILLFDEVVAQRDKYNLQLHSAFDTVRLFGDNIVSTAMNERDIAINIEGSEVFYTAGNYNQKQRAIVHLTRHNKKWSLPEILSWSGRYMDIEPSLSPDNQFLYFSSTRPIYGDSTRRDYNIWFSKKTIDGWAEPLPLDSVINTKYDEYYPSIGKCGNIYFTAAYPSAIGKEDIFMSEFISGRYAKPVPLDSNINSVRYEFNAYISPSEDTLIFTSFGRSDDMGGGDLYISIRNSYGQWQKARNLGPTINSTALDYCPFIDYPRNTFYFTSNRGNNFTGTVENFSEFKKNANSTLNGLDNIYEVLLPALSPGN